MKRVFWEDQIILDPSRITTGAHPIFGDTTIFHDVVVASEMVQLYEDGKALKSRDELEAYVDTMEFSCSVVVGGHPQAGIVSDLDDIGGRTFNHRYVKDLKDPKTERPNRAGIRADLEIFNKKISPELLSDMKNGKKQDVSIGFFFSKDETPGEFNGVAYDYVQRKMFHNHLAAGIDDGRCPTEYCGLGADELKQRISGDPFAGFKNWGACISKMTKPKEEGGEGMSEESAEKVCGKLKEEHEEESKEEDALRKSIKVLWEAMVDELEEVKGMKDAKKPEEKEWYMMLDWNTMRETYDTLPEDLKQKIIDAGLCPTCLVAKIANDLSLEEIDAKLRELKDRRDNIRTEARSLQDELWEEPESERKRKDALRTKIDGLWDEIYDIDDEIRAYTEAKSIKITQSASADDKKCEEGYTWSEEEEKCVPLEEEDSNKQPVCLEGFAWSEYDKECVPIAELKGVPKKDSIARAREVLKRSRELSG